MVKGVESLAYPSRLLSQKQRETPPRLPAERGADASVDWASVEDALDIVRATKANLLVIGPEWQVMDVIRWVIADARASIVTTCDEGRLRLPHRSPPGSTLVFRDIDELDAEGQSSLFGWLESAAGEAQIVCTASTELLSLVNAAAFDRCLFYRLNTICIRLTAS